MTPLEIAQASGDVPIGTVDAVEGSATVVRVDGATEPISSGTSIFQGDVVSTGSESNVSILFVDETTFSLDSDGEMTIDELVYDPDASSGSALFSVAEGVFTLVSGQIAKTDPDAMSLTTPIATIGIRGTAVAGQGGPEGFPNFFTLLPEFGGVVGEIVISNDVGVQILAAAFQTTQMSSAFVPPAAPVVISPAAASAIYGAVGRSFVTNVINAPNNPAGNNNGQGGNNGESGDGAPQTPEEAAAQAAEEAAAEAFEEALALGVSIDEAFALAGEAAVTASIEAFFDVSGADEFFADPGFDPIAGADLLAGTLEGAFGALIGGAGEDTFNDALNQEFGSDFDFFGQPDDFLFIDDFAFVEDDFFFEDENVDDLFLLTDDALIIVGDDTGASNLDQVDLIGGSGNDLFEAASNDPLLQITTDAEYITTGGFQDIVRYGSFSEMAGDTIADFTIGSDRVQLDIYEFGISGVDFYRTGNDQDTFDDATKINSTGSAPLASFQEVNDTDTSPLSVTANHEVLRFNGASFDSAANIESAINDSLVLNLSYTPVDALFLALYDNGSNSYLATVEISNATDSSAAIVTDRLVFEGVADSASFTSTEIDFYTSAPLN